MNIVIGLCSLVLICVVVYYLFKDNKLDKELKQEQLNYYKNYNKLFEEDDDDKEGDNEED